MAFDTFCSKIKVLRLNIDYFNRSPAWRGLTTPDFQNFLDAFLRLEKVEFLVYGKEGNKFVMCEEGCDLHSLNHDITGFIRLLPETVRVEFSDRLSMPNKIFVPKAKLEGLLQLDT